MGRFADFWHRVDEIDQRLARKGLTVIANPDFGLNNMYFGWPASSSWNASREQITNDFLGYIECAYKANGIVFACVQARALPFSEARFQYQRFNSGRPGDLFGDPSLALLENPWPNGTTGELLYRMLQDVDLAGNFYATTVGTGADRRIRRLRPDWVTIVSGVRDEYPDGSPYELGAEVLFYIYAPRDYSGSAPVKPVMITPDRMVHWSPTPDPDAQWRGMSWLTPVLREVLADTAATDHKEHFFKNGATPSFGIKYDPSVTAEQFLRFKAEFDASFAGNTNAYKVLHLGGGADPFTVGANMQQLDFRAVQGAGETRIAAAAGVGAIIARFSEGLAGSALNQGNYAAAKRQFADMTLRPLWRTAAAALSKFAAAPGGTRLWYDARDVAFLAEDQKDASEILSTKAMTIRQLIDAGYDPDAAVSAVQNGDLGLLAGRHGGLFSVQLQAPGAGSGGDEVLSLDKKVEAAGALVRAGYDPAGALSAVGLDPIRHLGLLPVTLQSARQLQLTPAEANGVTT